MTYECFVRRAGRSKGVTLEGNTQKPRKLIYKRHHCLFHTTDSHTLKHILCYDFHLPIYSLRNNTPHTTRPNTQQSCLQEETPSTSRALATRPLRRKSGTSSASGKFLALLSEDRWTRTGVGDVGRSLSQSICPLRGIDTCKRNHTNTHPAARFPTSPSNPSPQTRPPSHTP